jgi:hypothetical protein
LPKTLKEVCDTLINKYGHQALWLDMRSGANGPGLYQSKQPVVISCSRRDLAEHDGKKWHLLNSPLYLDFDPWMIHLIRSLPRIFISMMRLIETICIGTHNKNGAE